MDQQNDIKLKILMAAKKLFAKQGFEGTTVRQICEEAGGNVALVSYHFGGKENVFFALFDSLFPGSKLDHYEEHFKDPVIGLQLIIDGVIRFHQEDPELAAILQHEIALQTPRVERLRDYIFPVWKKLRHMLEEGRNQGLFHFRSLDRAMTFVMGVVLQPKCSPFIQPLLTEGDPSIEDLVHDTISFVFNGLGYQIKNFQDK